MNLPVGEWLVFCISIMTFIEWESFRLEPYLKFLPLVWLVGWILELMFMPNGIYYWYFSRIFVLIAFFFIAIQRCSKFEIMPLVLTSLTLLVHDLLVINEPGIFWYDHWVAGIIMMLLAYLSSDNLWNMALGITGGMLVNIGFSIFLFNGIVKHLNLPDPFFWHFSVVAFVLIAMLKTLRSQVKF